jgi:hypothetical protein
MIYIKMIIEEILKINSMVMIEFYSMINQVFEDYLNLIKNLLMLKNSMKDLTLSLIWEIDYSN